VTLSFWLKMKAMAASLDILKVPKEWQSMAANGSVE
jgi:hypothetical protein